MQREGWQLIVADVQSTRVRAIFELAAEGQSLAEIANAANRKGWETTMHTSSSTSKWTPRRISSVLSNRHYTGQIKYGDQWLPGLHEAIVDVALFNAAKEKVHSRKTTRSTYARRNSIAHALVGLVDCPKCGRKLSIGTDIKRLDHLCKMVTAYYRCRSHAGGRKPCSGVRIQTWQLEGRVIHTIGKSDRNPAAADRIEQNSDGNSQFAHYWQSLNNVQQSKLLPLIVERVLPTDGYTTLTIYMKPDAFDYVQCMATYGQPQPPVSIPGPNTSSIRRRKQKRNRMIAIPEPNSESPTLRARILRVNRDELFYDDLNATAMLMRRCGISDADILSLIDVVGEDLLDGDPARFDYLQSIPEPDGDEINWRDGYLLATPTDDWIAAIVACRSLIELKSEEAIPIFIDLLFESWRFPRLSVGIEAERFFAPIGRISIEPLIQAFDLSGPNEDDGRRNVVAALGKTGGKHPELQSEIVPKLVQWLSRHEVENLESNSEIICVLLDFKAGQSADVIHAALEAGCVDEGVCGDWNEIRSELI